MINLRVLFNSYSLLFVVIIGILLLPQQIVLQIRSVAISCFGVISSPLIKKKDKVQLACEAFLGVDIIEKVCLLEKKNQELEFKNYELEQQLEKVRSLLCYEEDCDFFLSQVVSIFGKKGQQIATRHQEQVLNLLERRLEALYADVIYVDPTPWSTTIWINCGRQSGSKELVYNSPVLVGHQLIGVVDYIGESSSRVRLITDRSLNPSVRVARGLYSQLICQNHLHLLLQDVLYHSFPLYNQTVLETFLKDCLKNMETLSWEKSLLLAKGVTSGKSEFKLRSRPFCLKGEGFNYDFADEEGDAKDLRLGGIQDESSRFLIEQGDLLVTTGMDGVFPPGLVVARVVNKHGLKEGAVAYDVDAEIFEYDLKNIRNVCVIKPVMDSRFAEDL